jgi:hypothetical protein
VATRKRGVLILECLADSDPGSEGMFLSQMLRLMKIEHQYVEVRTKRQLTVMLGTSPYDIIHVTTHGSWRRRQGNKKFRGFWVPGGALSTSDLGNLKGRLKGCSVVSTACLSGDRRFAKAFSSTTDCSYYVAPTGNPTFEGAIFFAHIFYHKLFVMKKSIDRVLREYDRGSRNVYGFAIVPFGKFIKKTMK